MNLNLLDILACSTALGDGKLLAKSVVTIVTVSLFSILPSRTGNADELYKQFSLVSDSLTATPADAKAPEPGIVTAKYGFRLARDFMPYMGTGLAYAYQPNIKTGDIVNVKTGVAAQFGFSYLLGEFSTLKLDYKYLSISPEQARGDSRTPPQSLGIGLDIKF